MAGVLAYHQRHSRLRAITRNASVRQWDAFVPTVDNVTRMLASKTVRPLWNRRAPGLFVRWHARCFPAVRPLRAPS